MIRNRRSSGFTILELVVVMAILVALAGIVVAKFDLLQLKAEKGAAASNMGNLLRYIQTYRATTKVYPDRYDSLFVTGSTTLPAPGNPGAGNPAGLDPSLTGGPPAGSHRKLVPTTLATDDEVRSLARVGISTVIDHDTSTSSPYANGFVTQRTLATGNTVATIDATDSDGAAIINAIYPAPGGGGTVPAGKKLVVFGIGKNCTLIGNNTTSALLADAPNYPYESQQYYDKYLAVFEISTGGSRARIVAVLGADGDLQSEEIADFNEQ